jgi:hypothetical protein
MRLMLAMCMCVVALQVAPKLIKDAFINDSLLQNIDLVLA